MSTDRLTGILRAVVQALVPKLAFYVQWEYTVTSQPQTGSGTVQVSGTASSPDAPIQRIANIDVWPDAGGNVAIPAVGSRVRVGFVDADGRKPAVMGLDPLVPPTRAFLASGLTAGTIALSAPTDSAIATIVDAFNGHTHATAALGSPSLPTPFSTATVPIQPAPGTTASALTYSP